MFRILKETYFWPITAHVAEDGQIVEKVLFEVEFKRHGVKDIVEIGKQDPLEQIKSIIVGWRGCKDIEGDDVPFSETALADLVEEFPDVTALFFQAYNDSVRLIKRKN